MLHYWVYKSVYTIFSKQAHISVYILVMSCIWLQSQSHGVGYCCKVLECKKKTHAYTIIHYYIWKTYVTQSLKYFSLLYGDCNVTHTKMPILPSICLPTQTASASLNLTFWSQLTQQIQFVKYVIEAYSKQTWIYHFINIGRWDNKQEINLDKICTMTGDFMQDLIYSGFYISYEINHIDPMHWNHHILVML